MADIEYLNARHFKIVDLCLRGWTYMQISNHLEMSPNQVRIIVRSPSFQHQLAVKRQLLDEKLVLDIAEEDKEANELLKASAKAAAKKLVTHLDSADEKISIRASESILDRTGSPKVAPAHNQQNIGAVFMISNKESKRIVEAIELSTNSKQAETSDKPSSDQPMSTRDETQSQPVLSSQQVPTDKSVSVSE